MQLVDVILLTFVTFAQAKNHGVHRKAANEPVAHSPRSSERAKSSEHTLPPRRLQEYEEGSIGYQASPLEVLSPMAGILSVPREILGGLLIGQNPLYGAAAGTPVSTLNQNVGELFDRSRNVAGSSFDALEHLATGFAQRGRNVFDKASTKAASFMGNSVNLGSNGMGTGLEAVRGIQNEARRIAEQAVGAASVGLRGGLAPGRLPFLTPFAPEI